MKVINFILSAVFIQNLVRGKLTIAPADTVVLLGQSTYFNCSTSMNDSYVNWYFYPIGVSERENVFMNGQLCNLCVERFQIGRSSRGVFSLIILSARIGDAGKYVCQDDEGFGDSISAELIVLDDNPVCNTHAMTTGFIGPNSCGFQPDIVQLSCRIKYHGNQRPTVTWKTSGDDKPISEGTNHTMNASHVDYLLSMNADISSHKHAYFCETNQSAISQYRCRNATVINILYAFSSSIALNKTQGDEEIVCSANSSVPCNYKWEKIDNNKKVTVFFDKTLKLNDPGTYRCQADCPLGSSTCTITVMTVDISAAEESSGHGIIALYVLLAVSFIIIFIVVVVLVIRLLKKRTTKPSPRDTSPTGNPESNALLVSQQNPPSTSGDTNIEDIQVEQGGLSQTSVTNSSATSDNRKNVSGELPPVQPSVSNSIYRKLQSFRRWQSNPWGPSEKT